MTDEIVILGVAKKKNKYQVLTSEKTYSFSEETILKNLVFKDKVFSRSEFQAVMDDESQNDLLNKTLKFITFQSRSVAEIKKYLNKKSDNPNHRRTVLEKLSLLGYLNDESFAANLLDYEIRSQKGPKSVEFKLKQKGISPEIIAKTLIAYDHSIETEIVKTAAEKLHERHLDEPISKQKQLIYQKLLRDGFSNSVISSVMSQLQFADNSDAKLQGEYQRMRMRYHSILPKEGKERIIRNLLAKGYAYGQILRIMKEAAESDDQMDEEDFKAEN